VAVPLLACESPSFVYRQWQCCSLVRALRSFTASGSAAARLPEPFVHLPRVAVLLLACESPSFVYREWQCCCSLARALRSFTASGSAARLREPFVRLPPVAVLILACESPSFTYRLWQCSLPLRVCSTSSLLEQTRQDSYKTAQHSHFDVFPPISSVPHTQRLGF